MRYVLMFAGAALFAYLLTLGIRALMSERSAEQQPENDGE